MGGWTEGIDNESINQQYAYIFPLSIGEKFEAVII